jgi:hypothetical protein
MRWGSLVATLLMAGASTTLPRLMARATGIDAGGLTGMISQIQAASSGGNLDADVSRQLQAIENGQTEDIPLRQLAAVQNLSQGPDMTSALLNAFKNQTPIGSEWREGLLRFSEQVRQFYRGRRRQIENGLILGALGLLAVAILGALPFLRGPARFLLTMAFALSGRFLLLASLACAAYFAASQLNPIPLLPAEVFAAPVGYMLFCGLFLRIIDPNYPLWNTMLYSFAAPIAASLGIAGWLKFKPSLPA